MENGLFFMYCMVATCVVACLILPFISLVLSTFRPMPAPAPATDEKDFACLITAYQNATIALPLVDSLLKQQYNNYVVYLVADDCDIQLLPVPSGRVVVLKPESALRSKVKSIRYAMDRFQRAHEAVVIFDPDNLAHPNFLSEINGYFAQGYRAVQGQRLAKNLDTLYACLDAMGEFYYNYVVRKVPFNIGSSATIAGSAMAIETNLYLDYLHHPAISGHIDQVIVAEDKILQSQLVENGHRIAYAEKALVYDEKVVSASQVERQRTRWINSYFKHVAEGLALTMKGLAKRSMNQLFFGYLLIYPPMFLLVLATLVLLLVSSLVSWTGFLVVAGSLLVFVVNFLLALWLNHAPAPVWKALWGIPAFMFKQVLALLKIQRSNRDFMATTHTRHLTIEEVMSGEKKAG